MRLPILLFVVVISAVASPSHGMDWRKLGKVVSPECWMGLAGALPTAVVSGEIPKFVDAIAVDSKSAQEEGNSVLYLTRNGMSVGAAPIKSLTLNEFLIAHSAKSPLDKILQVQLRRLGTDLAHYTDISGIRYVYLHADDVWTLFQEKTPFLKNVSKAGDAVFFSYFNATKPVVRIPYAAMTAILTHINLTQDNLAMASTIPKITSQIFELVTLLQTIRPFGISGETTLTPETSEVFSTPSFPKYVYPSLEALMVHGRRVRFDFNGSTLDLVRQFARNTKMETGDLWLAQDDFANSLLSYDTNFPRVSYHAMFPESPIWTEGFGTDVQRLSWGIGSTLVDELFLRGRIDMAAMLSEGNEFAVNFFTRAGNTLGAGLELIDAENLNRNLVRELLIARFLVPRSFDQVGFNAANELGNLLGLRIPDSNFSLSPDNDVHRIDAQLTQLFKANTFDFNQYEKKRADLAMAFAIKLWDASRAQLRARMLPSQANLQAYANFPVVFRDLLDQKTFVFTEETDLRFSGTAAHVFRK